MKEQEQRYFHKSSQKYHNACSEKNVNQFILIIDNASCHVSKKNIRQFVERQSKWLTVFYLNKRSPFLNPVEAKVKRNLQKDICANYFYETEEKLLCSVRKYLGRTGCWV